MYFTTSPKLITSAAEATQMVIQCPVQQCSWHMLASESMWRDGQEVRMFPRAAATDPLQKTH